MGKQQKQRQKEDVSEKGLKTKRRKDWASNRDRRHADSESDEGFEEVSISLVPSAPLGQTDQEDDTAIGMEELETEEKDTRKLIQEQNRKKKKSGGFQSMGLSHQVFTGILRKGYKIPTPIQRKTIPVIMDGKDVVAMARTGSGKTAAFLIPMFERLKVHSAQSGARALILSPTRELALQTLKFTKELGKYTSLKAVVVLGGDKMEDQFAALHENPDIIIATPGRFMHVLVEMGMKMSQVEYIVFDEADRLFEMGFQEQLQEILDRVPESRQTVLFSATLPKLLVEFSKAGLQDPTLIRLDVDTKLSEQLRLHFLQCRHDDKTAALLYLLRNVVKPSEQTVVFVATKHHVEFLNMVLTEAGITCSYSYSSLDQTARKIHVAKFRNKTTMVLLVTDLAARGIDIPMLDNVINYNFPAKPKLFVHRVGRVARAGRSGTAYSIVSPDEVPYILDLHLFLGRPLKPVLTKDQKGDGLYGRIPQVVLDDEDENLRTWCQKTDISSMRRVTERAQGNYMRSRPAASTESNKRAKEMANLSLHYHPLFDVGVSSVDMDDERMNFLENVQNYRPQTTIFEIHADKRKEGYGVMKDKRRRHGNVVEATRVQREERKRKMLASSMTSSPEGMETTTDPDLQDAFNTVVAPKFHSNHVPKPKKPKTKPEIVDEENYLHYRPKEFHSEKGLGLGTSFDNETANAMFDVGADDEQNKRKMNNALVWDRKRKKYVRETGSDPKRKKLKTESGNWIPASYKSNMYKEWLGKNQAGAESGSEDEGEPDRDHSRKGHHRSNRGHRLQTGGRGGRGGQGSRGKRQGAPPSKPPGGRTPRKNEMKSADQILKQRRKTSVTRNFQQKRGQGGGRGRGGQSRGQGGIRGRGGQGGSRGRGGQGGSRGRGGQGGSRGRGGQGGRGRGRGRGR